MATTVYFGQDATANGVFVPGGASQTARNAFVAAVQAGWQVEGFSTTGLDPFLNDPWRVSNWGGAPWPLWGGFGQLTPSDYADAKALLTPSKIRGGTNLGRFDTTGPDEFDNPSWWWETDKNFTIALSGARTAFGFYGTDFSDWGGTVTVRLFSGATQVGSDLQLTLAGGGTTNGGLLFWGVTSDVSFDSVRVVLVQSDPNPANYDVAGFDDLIVGNAIVSAPPPPPPPPPPAECHAWPGGMVAI